MLAYAVERQRQPDMDYCFDTGAIGAKHAPCLYDDPHRAAIVAGLLASGRVLITTVNVFEAVGCEDSLRRTGLLRLEKQLSRDFLPLLLPNELLRAATITHSNRTANFAITVGDKHTGILQALHEPETLCDADRDEIFRWKRSLEDSFDAALRRARSELAKSFNSFSAVGLFSTARLIRFLRGREELILNTIRPTYRDVIGRDLTTATMRRLFLEIPPWPLYLLGWAHGLYHRAVKSQDFGVSSNAGTIDLMSAIYLAYCDYFVTSDVKQRRALRVLNVLNARRPRTRVISYEELRRRLVLQCAASP